MNLFRFIRKCVIDRPAAWRSFRLVARSLYGQAHWTVLPTAPLRYRLPSGGILILERHHSFTRCFWPGVDEYEPDVRAALLHFLRQGDTFVDCGSNIGYFSVLAAGIVGSDGCVVAIEANPTTYQLLKRNLAINRFGTPVHCAVMAQSGEVKLHTPRDGGDVYSCTRLGGLVRGDAIDTVTVKAQTLDQVIYERQLKRVDLLKIDIEGAEMEALRSASNVLREMRPTIICEYGTNTWPTFGAGPEDLMKLIAEYDYSVGVFDTHREVVVPVSARVWQQPYVNLLLQPER